MENTEDLWGLFTPIIVSVTSMTSVASMIPLTLSHLLSKRLLPYMRSGQTHLN